ncbi:hypothetical protein [Alistipes shahii]|uniref:hypothetical protein n=1 Tax=Alistipes shahii TaxID=328814 RepID=UPI003CF30E26
MTAETVKGAKLSPASAGYLGIYLRISDLFEALSETTAKIYPGPSSDTINGDCYKALEAVQDEVMKLFANSVAEHICTLNNNTEI